MKKRSPTKKTNNKPSAGTPQKSAKFSLWRSLIKPVLRVGFRLCLFLAIPGLLLLGGYLLYLDQQIQQRFEGRRWQLPAQVYARPMELYVGQSLSRAAFRSELKRLGYRATAKADTAGSYKQTRDKFLLTTRQFRFWDGEQASQQLRVTFAQGSVTRIEDLSNNKEVALTRLDPALIGSIYPAHGEDRVLVKLEDVPPILPAALIEVEDGDFETHWGLDFSAIARAFLVNLRAGEVRQGASTLTQQLVKNYFLDNRRTYTRKINEAFMSLLLELRYDKKELLEAYLNEVYLGQDGKRAIHGFGLGAQFYFGKPVGELTPQEAAMLVAIVRGPTYYQPRRYPERAMERRNKVLNLVERAGLLSPEVAEKARIAPLGVTEKGSLAATRYPAFIKLVREQLRLDYKEEDLTSEGLRIFTTLDPQVQVIAAQTAKKGLAEIEKAKQLEEGSLQTAMVVTSTQGGEVLAIVGGREAGLHGFNRAIDAKRQVGSVLKPMAYLTALENGYTLASPISDMPVDYQLPNGTRWTPSNYDNQSHGDVLLYRALAKSYNLATVNLGLDVGVERFIDTLQRLGLKERPPAYPSTLLGSLELSPLQVAQIYYPLAAEGFRTRLNAIREVLTVDGEPLKRYPLEVEQAVTPEANFLITRAMQKVMREGTGRGAFRYLDKEFDVAGKTGTTNGLRDSWFAGFSGDRLAVVWVGRDDNGDSGLTGSSGALPLWSQLMRQTSERSLMPLAPETIVDVQIDVGSGLRGDHGCSKTDFLPFVAGTEPQEWAGCALSSTERLREAEAQRRAGQPVSPYGQPSAPQQQAPAEEKPRGFWRRIFQ